MNKMTKRASIWDLVRDAIDGAAARYAQLSDGERMAVNAGVTGLAGAGIGGALGKKGKKGTSALIGALAGGATGAAASKFVNSPDWLQYIATRGTRGLLDNNKSGHDDNIGRNLLKYLAANNGGEAKRLLTESADGIGKPVKIKMPWWTESIDGPVSHFSLDSLLPSRDGDAEPAARRSSDGGGK